MFGTFYRKSALLYFLQILPQILDQPFTFSTKESCRCIYSHKVARYIYEIDVGNDPHPLQTGVSK